MVLKSAQVIELERLFEPKQSIPAKHSRLRVELRKLGETKRDLDCAQTCVSKDVYSVGVSSSRTPHLTDVQEIQVPDLMKRMAEKEGYSLERQPDIKNTSGQIRKMEFIFRKKK